MTFENAVPSRGVFRTIWQRKWWIAVPAVVSAAATWGLATWLVPAQYQSTLTMMITPQQMPASIVRPEMSMPIADRISSLEGRVLVRTRLERLIAEFDLYRDQRASGLMETVVERMRHDISFVTDGETVQVKFVADSPRMAQKVTEKLGTMVLDENMRDREALAEQTDTFLAAEREDAQRRLEVHDADVVKYKAAHPGRAMSTAMIVEGKVLEDTYRSLLEKREEARLVMNLVRRQGGAQFRIVDPARVPQRPMGPTRGWLSVMAALGGTLVGLALASLTARRS